MNYKVHDNEIILYQPDFDLDETLDCGQAFRWEKCRASMTVHIPAIFSTVR